MSGSELPATKARAVDSSDAPPAWAHQLFAQMTQLQAQFSALRLSVPPALLAPPVYPEQPAADTLAQLAQDPRLPDFLKPALPLLQHCLQSPWTRLCRPWGKPSTLRWSPG